MQLTAHESRHLIATAVGAALIFVVIIVPGVHLWFREEGLRWLHVLLVASTVSLALTPVMIGLARTWGLLDVPTERKAHDRPTPRIGGVAVYFAFLIAILTNSVFEDWMVGMLVGGTLLFVLGVVDDAVELPASLKLGGQLFAAGAVIYAGKVLTLFPPTPSGQLANMVITVIWIIGITNAFNFFDGMDGLASGLAILMAFFMGLVAMQTEQAGVGWIAIALIGAAAGFYPFNFRKSKPAFIFLGDGGSTFLGFTLACLAVKGNWADNNPIVSFSNPILIFGILIYDMIHITVERIVTGKIRTVKEWIDYVGRDHLHHRLERLLGSRQASIAMIYTLCVSLGLAAMLLRKADISEAFMLLTQAALLVILITILEHRGRPAVEERTRTVTAPQAERIVESDPSPAHKLS
jgi:UDP-GlcNAc:undecaprenyl-phosphate/decaprenyl-phosphate GlcNAc-1-phosphate transferase